MMNLSAAGLLPNFVRSMSITIECRRCGKKYHVKNELIGHNLRCKVCGGTIRVPLAHGGQVYRHAARARPVELVKGDLYRIRLITDHIEKNIGVVSDVLHEQVSDLVHIEIHVVLPTRQRPYITLVTSGMSDRPMNTPDAEDRETRFAELMLCLPEDWPVDQKRFDDETIYWPIRWLRMLARFPYEYDTWFGLGHTIPNGDPPVPFASNTELCCWLLAKPQIAPEAFHHLVEKDRLVNFYAAIPLYHEEIDLKLQHGADKLIAKLLDNEVTELIDPRRRNIGVRREW
jgi:hypothetical protein